MFNPFDPKKKMPDVEQEVLAIWNNDHTFERSVANREGNKPFVFYEGPPTANGRPGIHHVLSRTYKDVICRYQTMKGRYVVRKAGWDTHGLPVELQVEKALGLKNKQDIETYGVAKFNRQCQESVWQYKEEWERLTNRMGFWIDLDSPYVTYSTEYIQSVWWGFKQIWDKGLIYKDYKVVPYCTRCGTGLSLAEVAQGYKDVTETSVYTKFRIKNKDSENKPVEYILAWTTTPWTLPGNVALAVGQNIPYVKIKQANEIYYIAKDRLSVIEGEYETLAELTGQDLVGIEYFPIFDTIDLAKESGKKGYYVLAADFVTTQDGTGVVHTAVMYGDDDFQLGKSADLPAIHTVDGAGHFNELVPLWQGRFVKGAEKDIIAYLSEHNLLYKTQPITHSYPFCWRCGTPLLYYARSSWFIRIDQPLRDRLVKLNQQIKWVPDHVRDGRFGNWLEGLRDWAISRERYWGTPLPIWICERDTTHSRVFGSLAELKSAATDESLPILTNADFDLHKPYLDKITVTCPDCGGVMHRVPEVLDVWFDAGAMPFAQWGYPLNPASAELFKQQFPADFISEGIDQTRGWFNTLHIISTIIFDEPAYRSLICLNLVLDENGQKMSKSKGNVVSPWEVMDVTGIDALRMYFLTVNQPGDNKNFSLKAVSEVSRKSVMIWWNVVSFFLTYASVDQWQVGKVGETTKLDAWILALTAQTAKKIDSALTELDTFTASRSLIEYIDQLSTWYLRRSRKRREAGFYATLYEVLIQTATMAAPMMPFTAEATYRALRTGEMADSVHLRDYPHLPEADLQLLSDMEQVRQIVTLGHAFRAEASIKVRQPLASARVGGLSPLHPSLTEIIAEELNVKEVKWDGQTEKILSVTLDTILTPELKREGTYRDLIRSFQELRKQAGCQPGELVDFVFATQSEPVNEILSSDHESFLLEVSGRTLTPKRVSHQVKAELEAMIDGQLLQLAIIDG